MLGGVHQTKHDAVAVAEDDHQLADGQSIGLLHALDAHGEMGVELGQAADDVLDQGFQIQELAVVGEAQAGARVRFHPQVLGQSGHLDEEPRGVLGEVDREGRLACTQRGVELVYDVFQRKHDQELVLGQGRQVFAHGHLQEKMRAR